METLTAIERDVLKSASWSPVELETLFNRIRLPPNHVSLAQVADAVRSLWERGLIIPESNGPAPSDPEACDLGCVWKARFAPTTQGQALLAELKPEPSSGRIYFGMLKDMGVPEISEEEIAEARREMWGNFPRDFPE